jgi:hypothetical protein
MLQLKGFSGDLQCRAILWASAGLLATLNVKVFPGCWTRTGASSASNGQVVMFGLLVGRQVLVCMLLGFRSDVCPTGSPINGDRRDVLIGNDQQFKGTSNKSMAVPLSMGRGKTNVRL